MNNITKYMVFAINTIMIITCLMIALVLFVNHRQQNDIKQKVSRLTGTIVSLDQSVQELTYENKMKARIINTQEHEISLKDSFLTMKTTENRSLKTRLRRTQSQLQQTEQQIKIYAKQLDSLQNMDSLHFDFDRSNLKDRYRPDDSGQPDH